MAYGNKYKKWIEQARAQYAAGSDDDIEIDTKPKVATAEGGIWVQAWVWVSDEGSGATKKEIEHAHG